LYRTPQAGHVVANRIESPPMQAEVPAQPPALVISGQYTPHSLHAHHADNRDRDVDCRTQ